MKKPLIAVSALLWLLTACQHDFKNPFDTNVHLGGIGAFTAAPYGEAVRLDWEVTDEIKTGCRIERWTGSQNVTQGRMLTVVRLPERSYLDTSITTDLIYNYRIIGLSDQNETLPYFIQYASAKVTFNAPSDVEVTALSDSSVSLRWKSNNSAFASEFRIDRMASGDPAWTTVAETGLSEYTDTGLEMEKTYSYRISAVTLRNLSAPSPTAEITLSLPAPSGLQVTETQTGLLLSWQDNAVFETGYTVKLVADGRTDTTTATLSPDNQVFPLPTLDEDTEYRCFITAFTEKYRSGPLEGKLSYVLNFSLNQSLSGQSGEISSLCFFDDDKYLAAGSLDNTVKIWSTVTWEPVNTVAGTAGSQVTALDFVPGNDLVIGCQDGSVKVWNVFGWNQSALLNLNSYPLNDVLYAADRQRLVAAQYKYLYVWSTADWSYQEILSGHTGSISALAAAPGLGLLLSGGEDGIHIWSLETWTSVQTLPGVSGEVGSLCFSEDETLLAYGRADGGVRLLTAGDWTDFKSLNVSGAPSDLMFTADNNWLLCAGRALTAWFIDGFEKTEILGTSEGPFTALQGSRNGQWLAAGTSDGKIRILLPAGTWKIL